MLRSHACSLLYFPFPHSSLAFIPKGKGEETGGDALLFHSVEFQIPNLSFTTFPFKTFLEKGSWGVREGSVKDEWDNSSQDFQSTIPLRLPPYM